MNKPLPYIEPWCKQRHQVELFSRRVDSKTRRMVHHPLEIPLRPRTWTAVANILFPTGQTVRSGERLLPTPSDNGFPPLEVWYE